MTEIVVLCDNAAEPGFEAEHGLSLALRLADGRTWLWDVGQTDLFLRNAARLGLRPAEAEGLALSHGHYDHTGGLAALLASGFDGRVVVQADFDRPRWSLAEGRSPEDIAFSAAPFPDGSPPVERVTGPVRLAEGLTGLTAIPRLPGRFQATAGFFLDPEGRAPDAVPDDACLVLELDDGQGGLGVILGCCHSGLANTLAAVRERFGSRPVSFLLGGYHLMNGPASALTEAVETIREHGVARLLPGHCTGDEAVAVLCQAFGDRVEPLRAGRRLTV